MFDKNKNIIVLFFSTIFFFHFSCHSGNSQNTIIGKSFFYTLNQPDKTIQLPELLNEISGITASDSLHLLCVQDEDGIVFEYNLKKEKITRQISFHKKGDYEGIAIAGASVFVLRSDGDIFTFQTNNKEPEIQAQKYATRYSQEHDTEGMCFDQRNNRLLLVAKEESDAPKKWKNHIPVFSFPLSHHIMPDTPAFLIATEEVFDILEKKLNESNLSEFEKIASGKKFKIKFKISDLAIHPLNNHIFAVASIGGLIIEMKPDGKIIDASLLPGKLFPQPEGITFLPDGTMIISNEATNESSNLLLFKMNHE